MADVRATLQLKKSLAAAVSASRTEEIKGILQRLKKEVVATEDLIRETKIGVAVNKLRGNASKDVSDLAKEIVRKWKADVGPTAKSKGESLSPSASALPSPSPVPASPPVTRPSTASPKASLASSSSSKPLTTAPVKPAPSAASKPTPPAPPKPTTSANSSSTTSAPKRRESLMGAPRTHATDSLDFTKGHRATLDKTRDKCAEMVYDALASDSDAPTDLIEKRARDLENYVFAQHPPPAGTGAYRQKMRSLFLNLKAANNPSLRGDVVSGEITVARLFSMRPEEMASEEQQALNRKLAEKNLFDAQAAAPQQAETDAFQCGKCKQRRCMYYQMQTRSADEPMTTFVTCLSCNNRWKFS